MNYFYYICGPSSFLPIACSYFLVLNTLTRTQAPSRRHRCGSAIPSPPAPSCRQAIPKLELEARHLRNGDLYSHREDLEHAFYCVINGRFFSTFFALPPVGLFSCSPLRCTQEARVTLGASVGPGRGRSHVLWRFKVAKLANNNGIPFRQPRAKQAHRNPKQFYGFKRKGAPPNL